MNIEILNDIQLPVIPDEMKEYAYKHHADIQINIVPMDAINGYGLFVQRYVSLSRSAEWCPKCGYHSIFRKEEADGTHRHRYERGWVKVFIWREGNGPTLEKAFREWLKENENK